MSSHHQNQEPKSFLGAQSVQGDRVDDFQYDEVSIKDDWSLAEGEEELEATMKAVQERVPTSAAPGTSAVPDTDHLEAVDDFIRNYLLQMGMMDTLDCFQTEWYEMVEKGLVDAEQVSVVPTLYTENQRLQNAMKLMQLEREEYKLEASRLSEALLKVQRSRDLHKLQHMRAVQEKDKLIQDMKKLKTQCESYEPALKRMNDKYQTVVRHFTLLSLERDKARHLNATQDEAGRKQDRGATNQREKPPKD